MFSDRAPATIQNIKFNKFIITMDHLCGLVVGVPGCRPRGPAFDSRFYQIFFLGVGVELIERKVMAPIYKTEINDLGGSTTLTT
jgi:hypothetical protein